MPSPGSAIAVSCSRRWSRSSAASAKNETMAVGIFDLDGFKAYNDTFGHPAGDALLARIGGRLAAAVSGRGEAYRIGGDEFVVTTTAADGERVLTAAQTALSEQGAGFAIGCSPRRGEHRRRRYARGGAARRRPEALRATRSPLRAAEETSPRTFCCRCSTSRTKASSRTSPVCPTGGEHRDPHAADAAAGRADADRRTTARHRQGGDPGRDSREAGRARRGQERSFVQRHSAIGERIVSAAPTLEAIGQIVRAAHERPDGTGYPTASSSTRSPSAPASSPSWTHTTRWRTTAPIASPCRRQQRSRSFAGTRERSSMPRSSRPSPRRSPLATQCRERPDQPYRITARPPRRARMLGREGPRTRRPG